MEMPIKEVLTALVAFFGSMVVAYFTVEHKLKKEYEQGELLLLEIAKRYVLNFQNCVFNINKDTTVQEDIRIRKKMYLGELDEIVKAFSDIVKNPIYIMLLKEKPELTMVQLSLRREIIEQTESGVDTEVKFQPTAFKNVRGLYDLITDKLSKNDKAKLKDIEDIINKISKSQGSGLN